MEKESPLESRCYATPAPKFNPTIKAAHEAVHYEDPDEYAPILAGETE